MSWFDVLKRNPMEYAMDMRQRMGSSQPKPQVSEEVCAICGSKNFMRGEVLIQRDRRFANSVRREGSIRQQIGIG